MLALVLPFLAVTVNRLSLPPTLLLSLRKSSSVKPSPPAIAVSLLLIFPSRLFLVEI